MLAAAAAYAAAIAPGAIERDAGRVLPVAEIALLRQSGLLAAPIPVADGGAGTDVVTTMDIVRRIAVADPSIAQILQPHYAQVERARRMPRSSAPRRLVFGQARAGALIASAHAEREGPHAQAVRTRLQRGNDGCAKLVGHKFYSTGSAVAQWLAVGAMDDDGRPVTCLVPVDAPGVTILNDWDAIGQRGTTSGTTEFEGVAVPDERIILKSEAGGLTVPWNQALHLAVDLGIAQAAFADMLGFLRSEARAWTDGADALADESQRLERIGRLSARLEAATALFNRAMQFADVARDRDEPESVQLARLTIAEAKVFVTEVGLEIASSLLELGGARSAMGSYGLDRHWRNLRTHSLHVPDRWLLRHIGDIRLNGAPFPPGSKM